MLREQSPLHFLLPILLVGIIIEYRDTLTFKFILLFLIIFVIAFICFLIWCNGDLNKGIVYLYCYLFGDDLDRAPNWIKNRKNKIVGAKLAKQPGCFIFGDSYNVEPGKFNGICNDVEITEKFLNNHRIAIGPSGFGKTYGFLYPQIEYSISNNEFVLVINPKGESGFIDAVYTMACKHGREDDFELVSLAHPKSSDGINLIRFGDSSDIIGKLHSAADHTHDFYKNKYLEMLIQLVEVKGIKTIDGLLNAIPEKDKKECSSLIADLSLYSSKNTKDLFFNPKKNGINYHYFNRKILLINLSTSKNEELSRKIGNMCMAEIKNLAGNIQEGKSKKIKSTVYIDEVGSLISPNFVEAFAKIRSADISLCAATQSIKDLKKAGEVGYESIIQNCWAKTMFNDNSEECATIFSKISGTYKTTKTTTQFDGSSDDPNMTGRGSERDVDAFKLHPREMKALPEREAYFMYNHKGKVLEHIKLKYSLDITPYDLSEDIKTISNVLHDYSTTELTDSPKPLNANKNKRKGTQRMLHD